jgi:hypothetical protein
MLIRQTLGLTIAVRDHTIRSAASVSAAEHEEWQREHRLDDLPARPSPPIGKDHGGNADQRFRWIHARNETGFLTRKVSNAQ